MAALTFQQNLFRILLSVSISTLLLLLNCCQAQVVEEGTIRFDPPDSARGGTVEVFLDGVWGTISNDNLDDSNVPTVICRQLGFNGEAKKMKGTVYFGPWDNPVWLVECPDSASSILDCERSKAETVDLEPLESAMELESDEPFEMFNHENDLGVICEDSEDPPSVETTMFLQINFVASGIAFMCILTCAFLAYYCATRNNKPKVAASHGDDGYQSYENPYTSGPAYISYIVQSHPQQGSTAATVVPSPETKKE